MDWFWLTIDRPRAMLNSQLRMSEVTNKCVTDDDFAITLQPGTMWELTGGAGIQSAQSGEAEHFVPPVDWARRVRPGSATYAKREKLCFSLPL
jgi:hypothetical protein